MDAHATDTAPAGLEFRPVELAQAVRDAARKLGLEHVAFAPVDASDPDRKALARWLAAKYHGEMRFLEGPARDAPRELFPAARSIIVVAWPYTRRPPASLPAPADATVAAYALGADYHTALWDRLEGLEATIAALVGRPLTSRICVDSSPLLERALAAQAGLGFVGKSTMLIVPGVGTDVLLGELLLDVALPVGVPMPERCGACVACLDACPTGAFVAPYTVDARRCISYLTIEYRGVIPLELRALIGTHLFGCDICQRVCPFSHSPQPRTVAHELAARAALASPDPVAWLELTSSGYRKLTRHTALRRASREQLQRNAAIVLGNLAKPEHVPALVSSLRSNHSALGRTHVAWARGRFAGAVAEADAALHAAARDDVDPDVRREALAALAQSSSSITTGA